MTPEREAQFKVVLLGLQTALGACNEALQEQKENQIRLATNLARLWEVVGHLDDRLGDLFGELYRAKKKVEP